MLFIALTFFTVGAIMAGVAGNFAVLLAGRSLQGIGGGGIITLTEILVTDLVPLRLRGKWFSFISMMWAVGSVSGPIVGGAFAQDVSWVSEVLLPPKPSIDNQSEMDLLDQSSSMRRCLHHDSLVPQAQLQHQLIP